MSVKTANNANAADENPRAFSSWLLAQRSCLCQVGYQRQGGFSRF
jgi:hypothetical protein